MITAKEIRMTTGIKGDTEFIPLEEVETIIQSLQSQLVKNCASRDVLSYLLRRLTGKEVHGYMRPKRKR